MSYRQETVDFEKSKQVLKEFRIPPDVKL